MVRAWMVALVGVIACCGGAPSSPSTPRPIPAPTATAEPPNHEAPRDRPYVLVLGTAQDGGLPQIGCDDHGCPQAQAEPTRRRLVSSLLLVDPRRGQRWLFDATPDLVRQVHLAEGHPPKRPKPAGRPALFDGIFLTHAHIGHYTGLMFLGREAYGAARQTVFGTERMRQFLGRDEPWHQLVAEEHIVLQPLVPDTPVELGEDLRVTPVSVPHRDEITDCVAFVIAGPHRKLLFLPDIDKWERWERHVEDVIASVDLALVDGTFFDDREIPGRAMREIPHPFIVESLERLGRLPATERRKVVFTHLNHSNPAADPESEATERVEAAGMAIAERLDIHPL